VTEYEDVWGDSLGVTEPRAPLLEYPRSPVETTEELANFELPAEATPIQ
jgi:hypothetical protein